MSGTVGGLWRSARMFGSACVIAGTGALPTQAVHVEVGGIVYDVVLTAADSTYLAERALLVATPWFGNAGLTLEAATNFHIATGGDYGITPGAGAGGSDSVIFALSESTPAPPAAFGLRLTDESAGPGATTALVTGAPVGATTAFAYSLGPVSVPEIDGDALAKALFILFALGAWLDLRRRRRAV